ncbi:hypothetical protein POREN0001_0754 [Porphyromonas endodontalis ATCC 35406]|uniref:Uncharacterized protein n=1 Tax=Porphyromonas endodontalis (strain ATCC 35406 / DSM 24491 / JCM 8526 / CCUG 16442 / BCRC 14492 / NCTC 13058 / HG 370) TaxID=553175 RepID=C3J9K3_POREA|nr:hypothetical protein POREN0001_0754 [Porphyromonas endodontalis ATCC 35406]
MRRVIQGKELHIRTQLRAFAKNYLLLSFGESIFTPCAKGL